MSTRPCFALPVLLLCLVLGCAQPKAILDLKAPPAGPASATEATFLKVTDRRKFVVESDLTNKPRIDAFDSHEPAILVRTIGYLPGDGRLVFTLLPQGRTVETLVGDLVLAALKEKGYATAPPGLEVEIRNYWLFCGGRLLALSLTLDTELRLKGPMVEGGDALVAGHYVVAVPDVDPGTVLAHAEAGNRELVELIKAKLRKP